MLTRRLPIIQFVLGVLLCRPISSIPSSADTGQDGPFSKLIGQSLLKWTSPAMDAVHILETNKALSSSDVVGVFYSASWCAPCKQFLPVLEEFYKKMNHKAKGRFEIVWISINKDESEDDFLHYFRSMPWLAVPQDQVPLALENTAERFRLTGIPHLVILDGVDAAIITLDGREKVISDKYGIEFPWRPHSPFNLIPVNVRRRVSSFAADFKASLTQALHPMNILKTTKDLFVGVVKVAFRLITSFYDLVVKNLQDRAKAPLPTDNSVPL